MNINRSLRFKLIIGFVSIAVPLVLFLIYINFYAVSVVRTQVAESNKTLLFVYSKQIDAILNKEKNFMYNIAAQDPNFNSLASPSLSDDEYFLTKVRILNNLIAYHNYELGVDMFFAYVPSKHDLFMTQTANNGFEDEMAIQNTLPTLLQDIPTDSPYFLGWKLFTYNNKSALVRLLDTGYGSYVGAWISLDRLMSPKDLAALYQLGTVTFVSEEHQLLSESPNFELRGDQFTGLTFDPGKPYQLVDDGKQRFMVVSSELTQSALKLAVIIPEKKLLQSLPSFQKIILLIPVAALITLLFYLVFLNRIILKPMNLLLKGMRKIEHGNLDVRLDHQSSKEFNLIKETFNHMVTQIRQLKIDIYEEQIKVHKAEVKHLQVQINPHFLMNSVNIIYNLVEMKKYELIQRMAVHLVSYFRFLTRTHVSLVMISDEMQHILHYLNIHQLRFPERVTYHFHISEGLEKLLIPPLIIQPFVENCMKHGFDFMDKPFHIEIAVSPDEAGKLAIIAISDNGCGFSAESLADLRSGKYFDNEGDEHLGIWNVYHRLRLLYGQSIMWFDNKQGGGAMVELHIPLANHEGLGG
ncbi:histidine kinase [Paenibacillus sp. GCM10027628]|uniref:sensor histidine kinase n=1 Tax=Paenibacillus sp. GCM10027628 TaxID=3273413 RepID=UPI003633C681